MALYNIPIGFKIFAVLTYIKEMEHLQDSHFYRLNCIDMTWVLYTTHCMPKAY